MQEFKYEQDKFYIVNQLPIFATLSDEEKKLIASLSHFVEYKKFEDIYLQSSPPSKLYLVVTGRVEIFITQNNGKEEILEYLRRGQFFGILSLLTGELHSVSARAINDSLIIALEKDDFDYILKKIPHLAIYFSQYLSRRLKRKDLHSKTIFESTIVSVYSNMRSIGKTLYASNLALSLGKESKKRVILVNIFQSDKKNQSAFGDYLSKTPISLKESFINDTIIKNNCIKLDIGIDLLNINYPEDMTKEESFKIGALLGLLTNDYHYIVIDLPLEMDNIVFKALTQSDLIHLITGADKLFLDKIANLVNELKKNLKGKKDLIKIIVNEYGYSNALLHKERLKILNHEIYATLPDIEKHFSFEKEKIVANYPESKYAKVIRRIARQLSNILVGLALGSGGSMGLADIGILKVLEREKIPIDVISGTSIGGLIAAFWASGYSAKEMETIFKKHCKKSYLVSLLDFVFPKKGFIKGRRLEKFLKRYLNKKTFYETRLPLKLTACDIMNRNEVILDSGDLVSAIRATVSIPGIFEPIIIDKRILVDGGILDPVPVNILIQTGVSKIIAVNTLHSAVSSCNLRLGKRIPGIFDSIVISIESTEFIIGERSCEDSDIALRPILDDVAWFEFYQIDRIIKRGEEEAEKFLPQIKQLVFE